jgi:hexosaminidase
MTPAAFMYFDYYQGEPYNEPVAIGGLLTLEKVYSYEPVPTELTADEAVYIKGVQANVWSEFIHSAEKVEYMTWPRAAALAEVAWTPARIKNWEGFKGRMETQYQRYDAMGINYSKSAYNVWQTVTNAANKQATITLTTNSAKPEIHYTTDSTEPTITSPMYNAPFRVSTPATIKSATFKGGKQVSKVSVTSVNPEHAVYEGK